MTRPQHTDHLATRDLLEELARRLDLARGKVKLELIFVDGVLQDGYRHQRLAARDLAACSCRQHAWSPDCRVHPPSSHRLGVPA